MAEVGGFEVVLWIFCRSAVGQLIDQTPFGREGIRFRSPWDPRTVSGPNMAKLSLGAI